MTTEQRWGTAGLVLAFLTLVVACAAWLVPGQLALGWFRAYWKPVALVVVLLVIGIALWIKRATIADLPRSHKKKIAGFVLCAAIALVVWVARAAIMSFMMARYPIPGWILSLTLLALCLVTYAWRVQGAESRGGSISLMPSDATDLALWDYEGEWSTAAGKLIIGQSDRGGVVRCGTEWKDYEVSFDAHVISRNLGVIVRAKDSENYEMIQITPENLSPHRRRVANGRPEWNTEFVAIPHSCDVSQAFSCTLTAKGSQIKMTINDVEVLDERTFLENRKGSIGFRCAGGTSPPERAEVCNIRVRMLV